MKCSIPIAAMLIAAVCVPASAQWAETGKAVYTANAFYTNEIKTIPDGLGGVLIMWDASYTTEDVRVQRMTPDGRPLWGPQGVSVVASAARPLQPDIAADGAGGCVVVWTDVRGPDADIYAQRFDGDGVPMWTADGVRVLDRDYDQSEPCVANDGFGNYIIAFTDAFYGTGDYDIIAQRLDHLGNTTWAGWVQICVQGNNQWHPIIIPDHINGALIAWSDERNGATNNDIFALRVQADGSSTWTTGGEAVCTATGHQSGQQMVTDGQAGAVIVWQDERNPGDSDIYAQRVLVQGVMDWDANGVDVCTDPESQYAPMIAGDGQGGAAIVWQDNRPVTHSDVYAQYIDPDGAIMWGYNGTPVCSYTQNQYYAVIARCGDAGAYVAAWYDTRVPATPRIYAQRIEATGAMSWTTNGVAVADAPTGEQMAPAVCADPEMAGAVFAWWDDRNYRNDLYAQRLTLRWGEWGYPEPTMHEVVDIPADQGGWVAVKWWPSGRDMYPETLINTYRVWRSLDPPEMPARATALDAGELSRYLGDARVITNPADAADADGRTVWAQRTPGGTMNFWEWVSTVPADYQPGYLSTTWTTHDSTSTTTGSHFFKVTAHTATTPAMFWESGVMEGYSVDNLAPAAPLLLTAERVGNYVRLDWNSSGENEDDFAHYAVYRAGTSGVQPDPLYFLSASMDTTLWDEGATPGSAWYYVVTAIDVHENESEPSNEAMVDGSTTGIGDTPAPTVLMLRPNAPNPFGATTEIHVGLPRDAVVSLDVFDVAGRRVASRRYDDVARGWQRIAFDALSDNGRPLPSGVYFYRVRAAGQTVTRKLVIER